MKKKFLSLALAAISLCTCMFTACNNEEDSSSGANSNVTAKEEVKDLYTFEEGVFNVRMPIQFGVMDLNKDKQYVYSGEQSLKISPGNYMSNPYMYLPLESNLLGFSYTSNILKIKNYKFAVYAEENVTIGVGLYFDRAANYRGPEQNFTLSKGWNELTYTPQYSIMGMQYTVTDCKGMYLMFYNQEEMPTVYLDDVKIVLSDTTLSPEKLTTLKRTDTYFEICDFENAYQHLMTNVQVGRAKAPNLSIVKAADYNITAPSGNKVLRVELFDKEEATGSFSWVKWGFVPALIKEVNFAQFKGHLDEYALRFETYRDFELTGATYENLIEINAYYNGYGAMDWGGATIVEKGVWQTDSIPLSTFANFIDSQYNFQFSFIERGGTGSRVYYFDNFRIEKIA